LLKALGVVSLRIFAAGTVLAMMYLELCNYCWWQPEIRQSPVEVGSLSHYLQGFIHSNWLAGFLSSTVVRGLHVDVQTPSSFKWAVSPLASS